MFYDFRFTDTATPSAYGHCTRTNTKPSVSWSFIPCATAPVRHHMAGANGGTPHGQQDRKVEQVEGGLDPAALYLAPRELEVLRWAAQGKTTWETAKLLGLSEATVAFYVRRACSRLGVKSKIHAVAVCISSGLFRI
ncbi:response regulator transcription factor [Roseovarius mucosus]|uniref:response regulator transcription factor n=1 Tax=Roseovarius mucosus TaxID=215743 RepID=UPI003BAB7E36